MYEIASILSWFKSDKDERLTLKVRISAKAIPPFTVRDLEMHFLKSFFEISNGLSTSSSHQFKYLCNCLRGTHTIIIMLHLFKTTLHFVSYRYPIWCPEVSLRILLIFYRFEIPMHDVLLPLLRVIIWVLPILRQWIYISHCFLNFFACPPPPN